MGDHKFYYLTYILVAVLNILFLYTLKELAGVWHLVQSLLIVAFLIATLVAWKGLATKKSWSVNLLLVLFAAQAIDGLYLVAKLKIGVVYGIIIISIIGLWHTVFNVNIYRKKNVIEEIVRQAKLLQKAEKSIKEILEKKATSKRVAEVKPAAVKKKTATKVAKKSSKKTTKKKVTKKPVKKTIQKKAAKKKTANSAKKRVTKKSNIKVNTKKPAKKSPAKNKSTKKKSAKRASGKK